MTTDAPRTNAGPVTRRRSPRWMYLVSVVLVGWLGTQALAGWKFANGTTYPVVGAAMFNGPPNGSGQDFLVPRVYALDASGGRVEMDQRTFGIEPFEWRRWVKRHLEDAGDEHAAGFAGELAKLFASARPDAPTPTAIELWRVPATANGLDGGRLIRSVAL
jgi:hypothetical protein